MTHTQLVFKCITLEGKSQCVFLVKTITLSSKLGNPTDRIDSSVENLLHRLQLHMIHSDTVASQLSVLGSGRARLCAGDPSSSAIGKTESNAMLLKSVK